MRRSASSTFKSKNLILQLYTILNRYMIRDVFYFNKKPNVHPRERFAESLEDARRLATTEHFWIINEYSDYRNFDWDWDFEFLPDEDVWAQDHDNVWPSQHQKDSGTWLCPKVHKGYTVYRADVEPVLRKNEINDCWKVLDKIDLTKFDFSWHPDPSEPPYIYVWGNKWIPAELKSTVEYHVSGATEFKYMSRLVELIEQKDKWTELELIDRTKFDFTWRPDPTESPYIYRWGCKYFPVEEKHVLEYKVEGATEIKYMDQAVELLPEWDRWTEYDTIVNFDFTWRPDPKEPPFIYKWGCKYYPVEEKAVLEYRVPGATDVKYMDDLVDLEPQWERWKEIELVDRDKFDFAWRPDHKEPPFIYKWASKYYSMFERHVLEYHVPGATEVKYMDDLVDLEPQWERWNEIEKIDKTKFDLTWRPGLHEPPFIYKWGSKYTPVEEKSVLEYHVPSATEVKYMDDIIDLEPQWDRWKELELVDRAKFDFTWRPSLHEPPFIYKWGSKYTPVEEKSVLEYHVPSATEIKYMDQVVELLPEWSKWKIIYSVNRNRFDFTWRPDPKEPPFIYVFGNTQYPAEKMPTLEYHVEGATERKYIDSIKAVLAPDMSKWQIPSDFDKDTFDFSWHPDPHSPPYIYQFGSIADKHEGPRYVLPNNTGDIVYLDIGVQVKKYQIETTLTDLVNKHPTEVFWATRKNINYENFDFTWRPDLVDGSWESTYVSVFGSTDSELTQTYFVNAKSFLKGNTQFKFIETTEIDEKALSKLFVKPDMFFVDRYNQEANSRFEQLKEQFPTIQKVRYMNSWVDTINRCANKAATDLFWILDSQLDYSDFDFDYYPNPWQMKMVHVFGTQWSRWGTTFLINKETFSEDTKYVKIIEHLSMINFVKDRKAKVTQCQHDIVLIDHGNSETDALYELLKQKAGEREVTKIAYNASYLRTLKNLINTLVSKKEHYLWICSSICDYTNFDFTYISDPFAREQLHVFPSNKQKFGDTFLLDVNKTKEQLETITSLEEYEKINFNQTMRVDRLTEPTIIVHDDTHATAIPDEFDFPYVTMISRTDENIQTVNDEPMNLWSPRTKNILVMSEGATKIIVPREAKEYVKRELYDYPYIKKATKITKSKPLDIVFLSNGEQGAEENFEHLLKVTHKLSNRVTRVDGVNGRVQAYHAALEASNTPWAFTVFAKLKVNDKFDWSWEPDRLQIAKHYIFYAENPVNGLVYGHQAAIAYNKSLVLNNIGKGLDFTLDDEHEVVEELSGTAMFNTDAFATWRTAFRETIKLKAATDHMSKQRLNTWLTIAEGNFAEYCLKGAKDASNYYDEVNGDFNKLKLSYEWAWLKQRFDKY